MIISTRVAPATMEMVRCEAETSGATKPNGICGGA